MSSAPRKKIIKIRRPNHQRLLSVKQRSQVRTMINKSEELKQFPVFKTVSIDTSLQFQRLCDIDTGGDTIVNRDGLKVIPRSFEMKYEVAAGDSLNVVRVMLIRWKPNTADDTPTQAKILRVESPVATQEPLQPFVFEKSNRKKFVVLYDRVHYLSTAAKPNEGGTIRIYNTSKKSKMPAIFYNTTAATSGRKNGLQLCLISDSNAVTHPQIKYYGTLKFASP